METSKTTHIRRMFLRFLKENHVLVDYKRNIGNWTTRPFLSDRYGWCGFKNTCDSLPPYDWLNLAFAWEASELGRGGWLPLNDKWIQILEETNKTLNNLK